MENLPTVERRGCSRPVRCCGVAAAAFVVVLAILLVYALNMPQIRDLRVCQSHMVQIQAAIQRYHDVNNAYPPDLNALKKDYLKSESILRCPGDRRPRGESSFIYHRPPENAPDGFEMLVCECNRINPGIPVRRLVLTKGGQPKVERLGYGELVQQEEQRRRARESR